MGDGDVFYANQDIKKAIDNKIFVGPRITGAAHYISITGGGGDINYMSPEQNLIADGLIADGPQEIIKAIRKEIKYGSDWIKIMVTGAFMSVGDNPENVSFSPEELHAAVNEAKRHNIPVAAHAHATDGINQAVKAGVRSIEHGTYISDESISLMVKHGTFYVPTIYVGDYYANSDKLLAQEKNDDYYLSYRSEWLSMIENWFVFCFWKELNYEVANYKSISDRDSPIALTIESISESVDEKGNPSWSVSPPYLT